MITVHTNPHRDPNLAVNFQTLSNPANLSIRYLEEDAVTGLPKTLTRKEQTAGQQSSPTKRRARPTGKRTGGQPTRVTHPTRGMSLQKEEKLKTRTSKATPQRVQTVWRMLKKIVDNEISAPSPKNLNQKKTPLNALFAEPTQKSVQTCQSLVANAFGNLVSINTIEETKRGSKKKLQLNIASPTEATQLPTKPNLSSLI